MEHAEIELLLDREMPHTGHKRLPERSIIRPFSRPSNNIAVIECQIGSPRSEHTTPRELMSPTALRIARQRHAYSVPCVLDHDARDSPGSDAGHILDWPGKNHRYA